MNAIFQLLNPNNTVSVNRPLAHAIGLNEAVVYGALVAKYYWYSDRGMLDDGWFYSTAPDLQESTALTEKQQKRCVDALVKLGLLRCELRGMPAKRSFYIIEEIDLIQSLLAAGEAAMRQIKPAAAESYEKKRKTSAEPTESTARMNEFLAKAFGGTIPAAEQPSDVDVTEKPHNKAVLPCSDKRAEQVQPESEALLRQKVGASSAETSELYSNKTKDNNPDIINPSITRTREEPEESCVPAADMIDGMDFEQLKEERACYAQIVRDNTDYDILVEQFPEQADEINELISIMVDVICSQKKTIRANGEEKPHDVVKSRLLKLNSSHIEYVLAALKKNTSDVRNIRSYLITALYNAPVTMSSFYRAEVNHDMFGKR
ncbi:MAG: hypothetical protein KH345_08995 [Eubacterium sp.]|nr:hypothetical protein [Eubacterium sp.]